MPEINKKTLRNLFAVVASAIVLYWILHETERATHLYRIVKEILSPFIMGSVIAFIINVPMRSFEGRLKGIKQIKLRRLTAVLLTFIAVLLVLALVLWLLIPQLIETVQSLSPTLYRFFLQSEKFVKDFLSDNPKLMDWIYNNTNFGKIDWASLAQQALSILGNSLSTILSGAFSAIGDVAEVLVDLVIALVFAVYCLFQKETLARQGRKLLYAFFPEKFSDGFIRIMRLSNSTFSNFLSGQCLEVCILGVLFAISMAIFRMPYIPLVSVLVAVTAFIPVVGAFVGCAIGAFLILVNNHMQAVWFVIMFLVLQQFEGNIIYPRVVGTSIGLPGMWVLMAVAVGGELMGVVGMFLMIPVASVIYTLLREKTQKRLDSRNIDPEKLKEQPVERKSHFKEKREITKEKRANKKALKQTNKNQKS